MVYLQLYGTAGSTYTKAIYLDEDCIINILTLLHTLYLFKKYIIRSPRLLVQNVSIHQCETSYIN